MAFDRDCNAGFFIEQFAHWIPTPEMLSFNAQFRLRSLRARRYLGWIPIVVWRGRSYSRPATYGIFRQKATAQISAAWELLKSLALEPAALNGRIMQGILVSSRYSNAALRVEPPTADGFLYHIKYKTAPRHGIYLQREVNLRQRVVFHNLIHSTRAGDAFTREMMRKSLEFYDALGIREVRMVAGLSTGGAIWAQYGFRPKDVADWDNCKRAITDNRVLLLQLPENREVLTRHASAINDALVAHDSRAIWGIASMRSEVLSQGQPRKLGQALLYGARWNGVLDLTDSTVRFILTAELGVR